MKNKLLELRAHITNLDWDGDFVTCNRHSLLKEIDTIIDLCEAKTLGKADFSVSLGFDEGYSKGYSDAQREAAQEIREHYHPNDR